MANNFTYSDDGLALTKYFEGLRLEAYQDSGGVWTIGYGHTLGVTPGLVITADVADTLLQHDVQTAVRCVNSSVTAIITQCQFDALVDFAFNLGCGALKGSTLLKLVNAGEFDEAALQFERWDHDGGNVVPGLLRRRQSEAAMFRGEG